MTEMFVQHLHYLNALYIPCLNSVFLGISARQHFGKGNDENIGQGYGSLPQKQDQKEIKLGQVPRTIDYIRKQA